MSKDENSDYGKGVVFKQEDYAGFAARLLILVIDSVVVYFIVQFGWELDSWFYLNYYADHSYGTIVALLVLYFYLTTVKTSRFGTLGQILTKTRITSIYGTRPGQLQMTIRLCFWSIGPLNLVTDLAFLTLIKEKRTIRDCYCDTIVVKRSARPMSETAPIKVTRVFAFGLNLMYRSCYNESQ